MSLVDDAVDRPGERVDLDLRVIVSPGCGWFAERTPHIAGQAVHLGESLGRVGDLHVVSPFDGTLVVMDAADGQRLHPGERVAWLSVPPHDAG